MKVYLIPMGLLVLTMMSFFTPFPVCVFVAVIAAVLAIALFVLIVMMSKLTPAWEFTMAKMSGGMVLAILRRDRSGAIKRFVPDLNTIYTKKHGAFKVNPETVYSVGVPFAFAPGNVGVGMKPEFGQLTKDLTDAGVENLRDLATLDLMGRPVKLGEMEKYTVSVEVKHPDDTVTTEERQAFIPPRITGDRLKKLLQMVEIRQETTSMDDLWKYVQRNIHPGYTDADIKVGVNKEMFGREQIKTILYIVAIGAAVLMVCLGAYVLLQYHQTPVQIIRDNLGNIIQV